MSREHMHRTRMVPKRADELRDGGSLYWVIRGEVMCRQRLVDVRPFVDKEGIGRCHLVLEPKLVLVEPRPWRAFQGWRYLAAKDAPRDLDRVAPGAKNMPEALRRELRELGLLYDRALPGRQARRPIIAPCARNASRQPASPEREERHAIAINSRSR